MIDVSKATLLGLTTLMIVSCSVVWAADRGVKIELIDSLSENEIQELLAKAKEFTLIQVTNKVDSGIEIQCEAGSGLQVLGRTKVPPFYQYAFYFDPTVRMHDQYSCDVFWGKNQTHFEAYNKKELKDAGYHFDITETGVLLNGEEVKSW